ncbi:fimbrillin family protein, partial [Porphyromonadaceae bacterium OttesenSCG-928-L07]|nr:fimbrillin family protein [Porphyromonadaceae bacterium OttesenSCG-928-L07]
MKRAKNIIYAGVALLLVSACNNSVNDQDDRNLDTREEIQLSTQVLNTQVQPLSRATFTSGQTFHVVMTDNNSTFADQYSIATPGAVTSGKNALSLAPKKYWDDLGGITSDIKMFGVYPQFKQNGSTSTISSSDANSVISWTITADTSKSDLMSAVIPSYEYADRSTAAELTFNHVLSKVSIRVFSGNGGPDVSGAT